MRVDHNAWAGTQRRAYPAACTATHAPPSWVGPPRFPVPPAFRLDDPVSALCRQGRVAPHTITCASTILSFPRPQVPLATEGEAPRKECAPGRLYPRCIRKSHRGRQRRFHPPNVLRRGRQQVRTAAAAVAVAATPWRAQGAKGAMMLSAEQRVGTPWRRHTNARSDASWPSSRCGRTALRPRRCPSL